MTHIQINKSETKTDYYNSNVILGKKYTFLNECNLRFFLFLFFCQAFKDNLAMQKFLFLIFFYFF